MKFSWPTFCWPLQALAIMLSRLPPTPAILTAIEKLDDTVSASWWAIWQTLFSRTTILLYLIDWTWGLLMNSRCSVLMTSCIWVESFLFSYSEPLHFDLVPSPSRFSRGTILRRFFSTSQLPMRLLRSRTWGGGGRWDQITSQFHRYWYWNFSHPFRLQSHRSTIRLSSSCWTWRNWKKWVVFCKWSSKLWFVFEIINSLLFLVLQKRLTRVLCCYQPLCVVSHQSWFGFFFFCFINFPIWLPPSSSQAQERLRSWAFKQTYLEKVEEIGPPLVLVQKASKVGSIWSSFPPS